MTTTSFVLKRLADDWKLLVAIFTGITVAATLLSGAPIYISTLERQGINTAIDRADQYFLNIYAIAPYVTLSRESLDTTEQAFEDAANGSIAEIYRSRERYLKTPTFLAGTGRAPLISADRITADASRASRGYFQHLTNLADHVTFREGRMAGDDVSWSGGQPSLEAVVSSRSATAFGLEAGDVVVFTPSLSDPTRASVEIVGILEVTDPSEEYWQQNANIYIDPSPLDEIPDAGVEVDPNEPPLPLFVSRSALIEGIGGAYPGTLLTSTWFVFIDKEGLKGWDKTETRARLAAMEFEVSSAMQGSAVLTGIERLLDRFERRSFFTSVPLLVLLVVTAVTVLYYILMMVSYLVSSREKDVALLRSRGVRRVATVAHLRRRGAGDYADRRCAGAVPGDGGCCAGGQAGLLPRDHAGRVPARLHTVGGVRRLRRRWAAVHGDLRYTGRRRRENRTDRPQAALVQAAVRALLPALLRGRWTHGCRRPRVLGAVLARADNLRRAVRRIGGQRGAAVRAGAAPDRSRAAVHALLSADRALPERRLARAGAPDRLGGLGAAGGNGDHRGGQGRRDARLGLARGASGSNRRAVRRDVEGEAARVHSRRVRRRRPR